MSLMPVLGPGAGLNTDILSGLGDFSILNPQGVSDLSAMPNITNGSGGILDQLTALRQPSAFDWANVGLSGLQTLGGLWGAFQANSLAKKQFNFTKQITEKNLANQVQSYNTTLEDRARSRAAVEDQTAAEQQAYVDKNRLSGL